MKVFISQPMRDKTNEEIYKERRVVITKLKLKYSEPITVIDSFIESAPHNANPLWYLSESIKKLGDADIALFCKDWELYRGCVIEHECAVRYGIKCEYA